MVTTREDLQRLLDALPDDRLDEARAVLTLLAVPEDDEPLTDDELVSIREARAAYARGEFSTNDDLKVRMGW